MSSLGALLLLLSPALAADWEGEWLTDEGMMTLERDGSALRGAYGDGGKLEGTGDARRASFSWTNAGGAGTAEFALDEGGFSFEGSWRRSDGGGGGSWRGWRRDPDAEKGSPARFAGVWRSSLGVMMLEQKGDTVTGTYGAQGWGTVEGRVKGRRLRLAWRRLQWSGPAWLELTRDGKTFFGRTEEKQFTRWIGRRLEGFDREAKPKPGRIVRALTERGMCCYVHAPKTWRQGAKVDAVLLLHGSNWVSEGMVAVTAAKPEIGERFVVIGLDGESWNDTSAPDQPRQNYTYVNWMGRSTLQGYPFTDRESPWLVAEAVVELKRRLKIDRLFLGGHSQGGYLAWILAMHAPEHFAGVFPIAGGMVVQAEPNVFADGKLRAGQRAVPLAIVHGAADDVVPFSTGRYIVDRLAESGFPAFRLFTGDFGHPYDFCPFSDAILWLEAMSSPDENAQLAFGRKRAGEKAWRDVAAVCLRARERKRPFADLERLLDAAASERAGGFEKAIAAAKDGAFVDDFLRWKDEFEFAPAARGAVSAFERLRAQHEKPAEELFRKAVWETQDPEAKRGIYREIAERYWASPRYRTVMRWLSESS